MLSSTPEAMTVHCPAGADLNALQLPVLSKQTLKEEVTAGLMLMSAQADVVVAYVPQAGQKALPDPVKKVTDLAVS
ncbi:hypothetical protein GCM10017556_27110 [Micromonospora sagamiensis]|nr:hypothetical protein GCM10017556_27110 [Micromonospora sagamiensis]